MVLSLAQQLKQAHEKALGNIGNDLQALIHYVMEYEGVEGFNINDVQDALAARAAKTEQDPDYDMVLWVLQNDPSFYPEPDRSQAFEMPEEEEPHIV